MSSNSGSICVICAWRATCTKKYSVSSDISLRCPDYTEDVSLELPKAKSKEENSESA